MTEKDKRKIHLAEFKAIIRAIIAYDDVHMLCRHLTEHICRFFSVRGCSVMLFDERESQLFRVSSCGISERYLEKGPVFADEKYSAFATGEPVFIRDFHNDERVQYPEAALEEGLVSMLSVPVKYREAPIGLIRVYHDEVWELDPEDLESFCMVATLMGLLIEYNGVKNFLDKVKIAMDTLPPRMLKGL